MSRRKPSQNKSQQGSQVSQKRQASVRMEYNAPIPPPNMIEQYETILPGSAERIFKLAENQSAHRRELERMVVSGDNTRATRGQLFGFILVLLVVFLGFILIMLDKEAIGLASILTAVGSLVIAFITGTVSRARERKSKNSRQM